MWKRNSPQTVQLREAGKPNADGITCEWMDKIQQPRIPVRGPVNNSRLTSKSSGKESGAENWMGWKEDSMQGLGEDRKMPGLYQNKAWQAVI